MISLLLAQTDKRQEDFSERGEVYRQEANGLRGKLEMISEPHDWGERRLVRSSLTR